MTLHIGRLKVNIKSLFARKSFFHIYIHIAFFFFFPEDPERLIVV